MSFHPFIHPFVYLLLRWWNAVICARGNPAPLGAFVILILLFLIGCNVEI